MVPEPGVEPDLYFFRVALLPVELLGHKLVPEERIELSSPGYQPGALPLSYPGMAPSPGVEPRRARSKRAMLSFTSRGDTVTLSAKPGSS